MEKGISKYWTPEQEEAWVRRLEGYHTFATRHLLLAIRDLFKYDGRTKQAKRAIVQDKLRLATATDEELRELAELEEKMQGGGTLIIALVVFYIYKHLKPFKTRN